MYGFIKALYDASQQPGRHTRYFETMLKVLVDRALMHLISPLLNGISFEVQETHTVFYITINYVHNRSKISALHAIFIGLEERQLRFRGI